MKNLLLILLFLSVFSCTGQKEKLIGIQTFGEFNESLVDTIKNSIKQVYGFRVEVLTTKPMPKSAFVNVKSPRYRADTLLRILKRENPDRIDYVLGLTAKDISTTKRDRNGDVKKPEYKYLDWGVFGLGYRSGPSCVVSTYRIKSSDRNKFIERFKKICIHELGHNMGLKHCEYSEKCVMRDAAETIKTVDHVGLRLCKECKLRIL